MPEDEKFCDECGSALSKICRACGAEMAGGVNFCEECGTACGQLPAGLQSNPASKPAPAVLPEQDNHFHSVTEKKPSWIKKNRMKFIIAAGVIAVIAAIVLLVALQDESFSLAGRIVYVGRNRTTIYHMNEQITDISKLAKYTHVTEIILSRNHISDISALADLTQLERLVLYDNNVSDISALARLIQLKELGLSGNNISDISALASLTQLESLVFSGNNINDISVLANLTQLKTLNLDGNQISDVRALFNLENLQYLSLGGDSLSQEQINELIAALPDCRINISNK